MFAVSGAWLVVVLSEGCGFRWDGGVMDDRLHACPVAFSAVGGIRIDGRAECPACHRWIAAHPITGRLRPHKAPSVVLSNLVGEPPIYAPSVSPARSDR